MHIAAGIGYVALESVKFLAAIGENINLVSGIISGTCERAGKAYLLAVCIAQLQPALLYQPERLTGAQAQLLLARYQMLVFQISSEKCI